MKKLIFSIIIFSIFSLSLFSITETLQVGQRTSQEVIPLRSLNKNIKDLYAYVKYGGKTSIGRFCLIIMQYDSKLKTNEKVGTFYYKITSDERKGKIQQITIYAYRNHYEKKRTIRILGVRDDGIKIRY